MRLRQSGFSLLEVLVAFAILSISLGVLYNAFGHGLRNLALSARHDRALVLADALLAENGGLSPLREGSREGRTGDYRWRVEIHPYEAGGPELRLYRPYRVKVTVSWQEGGRRFSRSLETLRLGRS